MTDLTAEEEKELVEDMEAIIKDYFDDPYPPTETGADGNGKTYKMFAGVMLSVIRQRYELKRKEGV